MPSHKHKKKKKNHKKSKKTPDTSSSDDENSFWKIYQSDSDNERPQTGQILTSLVRKSYMNHIQQVLIENMTQGMGTAEPFNDSIHELASKWSSYFDQKALRASMLTELYRKSMVSSIKAIQAKTNAKSIYVDEKMFSKVNVTSSKESQTDVKKQCEAEIQTDCTLPKRMCIAETQTESLVSSLLDLPLPKCLTLSPSSRPYDPAIDFSDSSCPGVSSSQPPHLVTTTSVNQDVCSITSTSDLVSPAPDGKSAGKILQSAAITTAGSNVNIKGLKIKDDPHCKSSNNAKMKSDLNARLAAMGLVNDQENELDLKSKKSNWFAEEIAQSCNLTRVLLKMTTKQRKRVLLKMKELFGDEDEPLRELSEENIRICRKRIASVVVMELTPIYLAKRISSRYLFKYVAKQITNSLMNQSYAPDSRSIRQKVKQVFRNGHVIMSEADCR